MNYYNKSVKRLMNAIANIENEAECRAFFEDLCTIKEIQDMAQRLDVAVLLKKKESYNKIAQQVGVSTATISRVNRALSYGSNGYQTVLKKIDEDEKNGNN